LSDDSLNKEELDESLFSAEVLGISEVKKYIRTDTGRRSDKRYSISLEWKKADGNRHH
jgi:hypothetical protein